MPILSRIGSGYELFTAIKKICPRCNQQFGEQAFGHAVDCQGKNWHCPGNKFKFII